MKTVFSAAHDDEDDAKAPATPAEKATPGGKAEPAANKKAPIAEKMEIPRTSVHRILKELAAQENAG